MQPLKPEQKSWKIKDGSQEMTTNLLSIKCINLKIIIHIILKIYQIWYGNLLSYAVYLYQIQGIVKFYNSFCNILRKE